MNDKLMMKVWLNIGISNANHDDEFESDYTREEWSGLTEEEKSEYLDMIANDHASNYLDCGAEMIGVDE